MTSAAEAKKMALMEHLFELRTRLMYAAGAVLVSFMICYTFHKEIYDFLVAPLAELLNQKGGNRRMIYTAPQEAFFTYVKVSFYAGLFLAFPVVASQLWRFVAPGLYKHEKRAFLPFLILSPILFFMGGALVYYLIFPLAWEFFLSFETTSTGASTLAVELETKVGEYLSLVIRLIFAFGISFQLPLLLTLLAKVEACTSRGLAAKRKYAVVIVFMVAAVITPPDVISQVGLALPIMILYEISIFSVRNVERKRAAREAKEGHGDDDDEIEENDFNLS